MTRKSVTTNVAKQKAGGYKSVADNFFNGAEVAYEYEYYNAAGVLIVHAAIAYSDAITVKFQGIKSKGEDHHEAIILLQKVVGNLPEHKKAFTQLNKIIEHKNRVSYGGDLYEKKDVDEMRKLIERFKSWADKILTD